MSRRLLAALAAFSLPVAAQDAPRPNDADCRTVLEELRDASTIDIPETLPGPESLDACSFLATQIFREVARETALEYRQLTPRDVQPAQGQTGGLSGSPAQSEVTPGVQPVALAGGALSAAATSEGSGSIASLSVNPATFFAPSDPVRLAALTRMGDITFLTPVDRADGDGNGRLDYFGVRVRYDVTGVQRGRKVATDLEAAFAKLLLGYSANREGIKAILAGATDVSACAEALLDSTGSSVVACEGTAAPLAPGLEADYAAAAAAARREADAKYWGVDLRLDVGDPTLGATAGADGLAGGLGLAGGYRFGDAAGAPQLRGRVAAFYADRDSLAENRIGVDGSVGIQATRPYGLQLLSLGLAVEFQVTSGPEADIVAGLSELDRDYVRLRGALNVPIGGTYSVSLSAAVGTGGPTISVGGNWQTLLPGR